MKLRGYRLGLILPLCLAAAFWLAAPSGFRSFEALAAPSADPWPRWQTADQSNNATISFTAWNKLLQRYLTPAPKGINLFRYGAVTAADKANLDQLVARLAALPIGTYNRAQ